MKTYHRLLSDNCFALIDTIEEQEKIIEIIKQDRDIKKILNQFIEKRDTSDSNVKVAESIPNLSRWNNNLRMIALQLRMELKRFDDFEEGKEIENDIA